MEKIGFWFLRHSGSKRVLYCPICYFPTNFKKSGEIKKCRKCKNLIVSK